MKNGLDDTIAAIATPVGAGGVGVVRISGDQAIGVSETCIEAFPSNIIPSKIYHGWLIDQGRRLDEIIYFYFKAPHSYTGEDVVEFSCHGGKFILQKTLELIILAGARLAEKGEFTKRAFLNGKIDLAKAEAAVDLISAKSGAGLASAASQLSGALSAKVGRLRGRLLALLTELEAGIDFPDDIPEVGSLKVVSVCQEARAELDALLVTADGGRILREGIRVAIVGRPNVGKSSLLNVIIGHDRAIVSDLSGTTRDTIEEEVVVDGVSVVFVDTAGVGDSPVGVESLGISRTFREIDSADIVLNVFDGSVGLTAEDARLLSNINVDKSIFVLNKSDLGRALSLSQEFTRVPQISVSALTGAGIDGLRKAIVDYACRGKIMSSEVGLINLRHKECLARAAEALGELLSVAMPGVNADLSTIDLRRAVTALGEVSGHQVSGEIIDQIFDRFCVGK
jgi:tRNA modification GTPase